MWIKAAEIDAALMTVSPRFIPLDSRYEDEEKLWQEKRNFIEPLRYDGEEDVFPNSVLKGVPAWLVDGLSIVTNSAKVIHIRRILDAN